MRFFIFLILQEYVNVNWAFYFRMITLGLILLITFLLYWSDVLAFNMVFIKLYGFFLFEEAFMTVFAKKRSPVKKQSQA